MPNRFLRRPAAVGCVLLAGLLARCSGPVPGGAPAPDTAVSTAPPRDTAAAARDSVALRTDRLLYRAGEQATLTIENRTRGTYAFNPCHRQVERQASVGWTPVEEGRMCTMEAWLLEPGATRTAATSLPRDLAPGKYRLVLELTPEGGRNGGGRPVLAVSAPLTVEP